MPWLCRYQCLSSGCSEDLERQLDPRSEQFRSRLYFQSLELSSTRAHKSARYGVQNRSKELRYEFGRFTWFLIEKDCFELQREVFDWCRSV